MFFQSHIQQHFSVIYFELKKMYMLKMYTEKKYHTRHIHNKALSVHQSNETANSSFKPRPIFWSFLVIICQFMSLQLLTKCEKNGIISWSFMSMSHRRNSLHVKQDFKKRK